MSEPSVRVLLFAAARELVGAREVEMALPGTQATVADVMRALIERFPALSGHERSLRIAVNGEYARAGDPVRVGDEVAVIPPVAGG